MAESTLSLGYVDFAARVARQLGYGYSSTNWTADQAIEISDIVQSGYRQFLFPPVDIWPTPHEWSFLKGLGTLALISGTYQYTLPDDFDGAEGTFTFASTDNMKGPLKIVDENVIRSLREGRGSVSGVPQYIAVYPTTITAGTSGQRFSAEIWPTPSANYTLSYKYSKLVSILSSASPYPLGGGAYGETILASCQHRAALEANDDAMAYMSKFIERMKASVAHDCLRFQPGYFGNLGRPIEGSEATFIPDGVLYNGVIP